MKINIFISIIFTLILLILTAQAAQADCTGSAGVAGELEYDTGADDQHKYCNGAAWINVD